jgi:MoaA/NifB/PqqE/SkfB family radical SAM enzyme
MVEKFTDPYTTADGANRAVVPFSGLKTLWINTGTLCNLSCRNCYIESSPLNDRLAYISRSGAYQFLKEAAAHGSVTEIGFTGGEPFMNPDFLGIVEDALEFGFHVLILTNAMRPMQRLHRQFHELLRHYPDRIAVRVSLDHY